MRGLSPRPAAQRAPASSVASSSSNAAWVGLRSPSPLPAAWLGRGKPPCHSTELLAIEPSSPGPAVDLDRRRLAKRDGLGGQAASTGGVLARGGMAQHVRGPRETSPSLVAIYGRRGPCACNVRPHTCTSAAAPTARAHVNRCDDPVRSLAR